LERYPKSGVRIVIRTRRPKSELFFRPIRNKTKRKKNEDRPNKEENNGKGPTNTQTKTSF